MHPIIHTPAFILKSLESGEANRRVWLFTRDYGLIVATVQGVRKPAAKLRSHLLDYTLVNVDLVKGRDVWRLVSASVENNPFINSYDELSARTYIRALSLVERLCIEEGVHEELFEHLVSVLSFVGKTQTDNKLFDAVVLWKILVLLGYIDVPEEQHPLYSISLGDISTIPGTVTKALVIDVTNAIKRTHL